MLRVIRPEAGEELIRVLRPNPEDSSTCRTPSEESQENAEGHQNFEGRLKPPFSSSGFYKPLRSRNRKRTEFFDWTQEPSPFVLEQQDRVEYGIFILPLNNIPVITSAMPEAAGSHP
jgi:hypothetical protein